MKIPVDIRISNERINAASIMRGEERGETEEIVVSGTMRNTRRGLCIEYTEQDNSVMTTINVFKDDTVALNRIGPMRTHLIFTDGMAYDCIIGAGERQFQMRVRTKNLENTLTMDGGKLFVDYSVEIVGSLAEKNKLTLAVSPDASIIKS